jgi:pimeloyl-ACP methyl ester carboxylesterase
MECWVKDIPVYYEVLGEGRPLLVLSGWTVDHRWPLAELEPIFEQRGSWRRIYLDLPGRGRTPARDWITCQNHVLEILLGFVDRVLPGERFVLAGLSHGGYLARAIVHQRLASVGGLLLIVPVTEPQVQRRERPAHVTLVREPSLQVELTSREAEHLAGSAVVESRRFLQRLRDVILPAVDMADQTFLQRLRPNYVLSFDVDDLPQPFPGPTLILAGRQDADVGYRDVWRLLDSYPRATVAILDRAGHYLPVEQKRLFRILVAEWLDRVEESWEAGRGQTKP